MPLSINKLEKMLTENGLLPKKFFVIHSLCVYIEVLSISNADSFMLYIPSKYKISVDSHEDVYKVQYIDISEDGNIPDDYAGDLDNFDLEKQYGEIDIDVNLDNIRTNDIQGRLEESYKHPVSLKDIDKKDKLHLREIFRQLRRLKFCVQNLKYKLCIMFKEYICCIRRDGTIEAFYIRNIRGVPERKLMISLDLETLYEKIDSVAVDIKTIREGIYHVLDKNQTRHIRNLHKMMEKKNDLATFSDIVLNKKTQYATYLQKLEQLLATLGESELNSIEKLMALEERYNTDPSLKGMHSDIEKTHQIAKYETELTRINVVKQELIRNILITKTKHENLALKVDKICFDNIIMIDAILKNFIILSEL